jgi:hypothetical protein
MSISNAELAARLAEWAAHQQQWIEQVQAWWAGTPTGGPNGDGLYPFTTYDGVTRLVPCPALAGVGEPGGGIGHNGGPPLDIVLRYFEKPGANQVLDFLWLARPLRLPANLAGTQAHQSVNPLAIRSFYLRAGGTPMSGVDGDLVATLTVQVNGSWGFDTQGAVSLAAGTLLKLVGPAAVDGAMQGVFVTLQGEIG